MLDLFAGIAMGAILGAGIATAANPTLHKIALHLEQLAISAGEAIQQLIHLRVVANKAVNLAAAPSPAAPVPTDDAA